MKLLAIGIRGLARCLLLRSEENGFRNSESCQNKRRHVGVVFVKEIGKLYESWRTADHKSEVFDVRKS